MDSISSNKGFITATGSTQLGAAQITKAWTIITGGTGGVRGCPACIGDIEYTVENATGVTINYYPSFNNKVFGKAINAAFPILPGGKFVFKCYEFAVQRY